MYQALGLSCFHRANDVWDLVDLQARWALTFAVCGL